ncbi:hypothetical protein WJX84_005270 [Apatococcus fuscideae]|uniref:Ribosomal protein n=1 Tax=Apatococcus fuscideae TaxID=2026836 RepID=A0AAW1RRJ1_9CHLO
MFRSCKLLAGLSANEGPKLPLARQLQEQAAASEEAALQRDRKVAMTQAGIMGAQLDAPSLPRPTFILPKRRDHVPPMQLAEALQRVKAGAKAKFEETVEVSFKMGLDPRRSDQQVRGVVSLPHGTGKRLSVAVFAEGEQAEAALKAGAERVGGQKLIDEIAEAQGSGLQYDRCIATPDMMSRVAKIARILGPRGLMPNPKLGTVMLDAAAAVQATMRGQVEFR